MSVIIKNGNIITQDEKDRVLREGAVYIENDKIVAIGSTEEITSKYLQVENTIDADGRVVMPGLICSHMHFYSAFATGMPLDPFPPGFYNVLKHLWWKLDMALLKEDVYYSALLGYIQAVKSGTTTVIDHHASPSYIKGSLDDIENAGRQLGVRSNLCYEITDRNGKEGAELGLKENERYLEKVLSRNDGLFSGSMGLHASFTIESDTLDHASNIMNKLEVGTHVHVAEGGVDTQDALAKYDMTAVQRLDSHKLINSKSMLAHCIFLEDVDYPILKERDVNISHQPRSNMNNAVGMLNIEKLLENGINPGMGTDGMSSDMKPELATGALLQKHHRQNNNVGTMEVYNALLKQNPIIVKKMTGVNVGQLRPDYKADIMISDYRPKTPLSSDNVVGHVMFGVINEPVHSTLIDGKIRMLDHKIFGVDERAIHEKSVELAEKVWKRVADME